MEIKQFIFNPIQENTYVIWNSDTKEGAIVDCGALFEGEQQRLSDFIKENEIHIKYLLNTHMHFDHCLGSHWAAETYGVKLMAHKGDADIASRLSEQIRMFGLPFEVKTEPIGIFIDESSELSLGNEQIKVIETPGHSEGGVCFYIPTSNILLSGDTLFEGSIGRTDLEGGNYTQLIKSIKSKISVLPAATKVYCGHGSYTTIGDELKYNPYL